MHMSVGLITRRYDSGRLPTEDRRRADTLITLSSSRFNTHILPTHFLFLNFTRFCSWQARPPDYAADALYETRPISFHKFWQIDPYDVYTKWLTEDGSSERQTIPLENPSTLAKKPNHSSNNDQKDDDNQMRCSPPMDCSVGAIESKRPGDVIKILNSNKHKEL